ncbi:hypothetical protein E2986_14043 [Frieseomelitta varia]|uniref:Uncharacterized protein n=1 Tax=Frieseomelitta varia TaxID=561572 RepID=A0A833RQ86_9HYME|nr:hypothetical protein E2986_14043 [Frieseomelitta varia]
MKAAEYIQVEYTKMIRVTKGAQLRKVPIAQNFPQNNVKSVKYRKSVTSTVEYYSCIESSFSE